MAPWPNFDRALSGERSLLITWLGRGTLHLVRSEDYPWLLALTAPPLFTGSARRLRQEGVSAPDAERGVAAIAGALAEDGPLTRAQLGERVARAGIRIEGQALVHLLYLTCLRGLAVRGPTVGRDHAYALTRDWLGEVPRVDRDRALAELARRYLRGHWPAEDRDLANWAGLALREARSGLRAIASELHERSDGLLQLTASRAEDDLGLPPPRLLGNFDPVLHGWRSREFVLGPHQARITVGGMFSSFVMVEGRAVGRWKLGRGGVVLDPFEPLSDAVTQALVEDGRGVRRYLEL